MPDSTIIKHCPALAAQVDARKIAGTTLFTRVNDQNEVQTATLSPDVRVFWSLPAFLHGFGSRSGSADLGSILNANWQASGSNGQLSCGIGSDDRFYILSTGDEVRLDAGPMNSKFGFNSNGQFSQVVGPNNVIKAQGEWDRGIFELSQNFELTNKTNSVTFTAIGDFPRVQSLPTWIRRRGSEGDIDDIYSGLTVEDCDPQTGAHWLVESDGRVSVSYYQDNGFLLGNNLDFWKMLGGVGDEVGMMGQGGRQTLTTTYRAPSFLALDRPYLSLRRKSIERVETVVMTDGRMCTSAQPPLGGWELSVRVTGPAHGPTKDQERHLRRWWSHASNRVTLYPQWGSMDSPLGSMDLRRHTDERDVEYNTRYSTSHTIEADIDSSHFGKRKGGRMMLNRAPNSSRDHVETYTHEIDVHQDISFSFLDRVGE